MNTFLRVPLLEQQTVASWFPFGVGLRPAKKDALKKDPNMEIWRVTTQLINAWLGGSTVATVLLVKG